jgi:hypothetical protein
VLDEYKNGRISLLTEADLQSHLFSECIGLMKQRGAQVPFSVHAEKWVFEKRRKVDLVLGNDEVVVELKLEPDLPETGQGRVFTTIRGAGGVGYGSIEEELQKLENYAKKGKHAHFVMIDETDYHSKLIVPDLWRKITAEGKDVQLLHVYRKPT